MTLDENLPIMQGKVTELLSYGAMMRLDDGSKGLVHISEVSDDYVYSVNEYLAVGMVVDVAVMNTDDSGKKRLSIRKAGVELKKLDKSLRPKKPSEKEKQERKALKKQQLEQLRREAAQKLINCPPDSKVED